MRHRHAVVATLLISPGLLAAVVLRADAARTGQATAPASPSRIVSLVPAATEMLFAIGAGAQVVGVSSFDAYPPEVATRTRVGALVDPDLERILSLRPDLVVGDSSQQELKQQLARAGIRMFECGHGGLTSVTETLESLGRATGHATEAAVRARSLEQRLAAVRTRVAGRGRPRTLLVFGREPLALRNVYASGGVGFLHDMLVTAGADNVLADVARENVQATSELILARAPDVIVELKYGKPVSETELTQERAVWKALPGVPAVRAGRIVMLVGDEFVVPGPRVADATERLARALHPEAF
jgi:iron complex transport system substrate-binding protein